jgi:hypothetical protein
VPQSRPKWGQTGLKAGKPAKNGFLTNSRPDLTDFWGRFDGLLGPDRTGFGPHKTKRPGSEGSKPGREEYRERDDQ